MVVTIWQLIGGYRLQNNRKLHPIFFLLLFLISLIPATLLSSSRLDALDVDRVLFISSYHASFDTLPAQIEGIQAAFLDTNIQLDIEYMDTKRFP